MFLAISTSISIEGQEVFDSSFLESLPEGVRQDLLDQVTDKKELEDEQYRRPSTFVQKPTNDEGELLSNRFGVNIFDMMQKIDDWTKDDVERGIDGRFYEESYMNKWFLTHRRDTRTLHPCYAFPQMYQQYAEFPARMVHLKKDNAALENTEWD